MSNSSSAPILALPTKPLLQTLDPALQCLVYSDYDAHVHAALAAGVAGYVLKTDSLFAAVRAVQADWLAWLQQIFAIYMYLLIC